MREEFEAKERDYKQQLVLAQAKQKTLVAAVESHKADKQSLQE